jgi:hypothetical protein
MVNRSLCAMIASVSSAALDTPASPNGTSVG